MKYLNVYSTYGLSNWVTILAMVTGYYYGGLEAMLLVLILSIIEISLSFDNAIVNASVLKDMDEVWRRAFLTWGMLIAVVGVRLVLPLSIVSVSSGLPMLSVLDMSINNSEMYSELITGCYPVISAFGSTFLLLVFLGFILEEKDVHWNPFKRIIVFPQYFKVFVYISLVLIYSGIVIYYSTAEVVTILISSTLACFIYIVIGGFSSSMCNVLSVAKSGIIGFIYLEVLDASFSLDGVLAAFSVTTDIVIITLGLMAGAMFVRSMTIMLVENGTLDNYKYLEHGAHYAIGILSLFMVVGNIDHISEWVIGIVSILVIGYSVLKSIKSSQ